MSDTAPARRAYAGVGAHETPPESLALMRAGAAVLAAGGWTLRSGMSPGADRAFYSGALSGGGPIELYLPWPGFGDHARCEQEEREARVRVLARPHAHAYRLAGRFCRGFGELDPRRRALLARDGHQVLGAALSAPAALLVCWTPDGDLDGLGPRAGGTGQALRIARALGIAVLNVRRPEHAARVRGWLSRGGRADCNAADQAALHLAVQGRDELC